MLWRLPCEIAFQFFHFLQRRYAMRSLRRGLLCGGIALICCCLVLGQVKADTLNAYWKFNESSGTTAANSGTGGTTLNGSLLGSESFTSTAKFGNAVSSPYTTGSYVDVTSEVIADQASAYTYSLWFNSTATDTAQHYLLESTPNANNYAMSARMTRDASGNAKFEIFAKDTSAAGMDSVTYTVSGGVSDWNLLTVTYANGNALSLYLNGGLVGSDTSMSSYSLASTDGLHIGSDRAAGRLWKGYLDDAAIWSNVLSAGEVKAIAALGNSSIYAYDAGKVNLLIASYEGSKADVTIGGVTWKYSTGLGSTLGLIDDNTLVLSSSGDGFTVIPEPSSFLLLSLGVLSLLAYAWRKRK